MAKIPKKERLSVYLDPSVMKALADYAARRDQSRSHVDSPPAHHRSVHQNPALRNRREPITRSCDNHMSRACTQMLDHFCATDPQS